MGRKRAVPHEIAVVVVVTVGVGACAESGRVTPRRGTFESVSDASVEPTPSGVAPAKGAAAPVTPPPPSRDAAADEGPPPAGECGGATETSCLCAAGIRPDDEEQCGQRCQACKRACTRACSSVTGGETPCEQECFCRCELRERECEDDHLRPDGECGEDDEDDDDDEDDEDDEDEDDDLQRTAPASSR